ncbi:DUF624 domain-containing protein [Paraoerskovia marina]|uniref:DUF624 domain-containing protein n=1 Tax=Paraoerskovia marina TaxID=545619 RepID=UPI000694DF5D|nr:DUF624 domain-containing protein [Paraoerskovia marina]
MTAGQTPRRAGRGAEGWEAKTLRALAYPANIVLGGLAATLLAIPVVTALPAAVALARALHAWRVDGDDAVFTNTFREFGATWRRTLPTGAVTAGAGALLLVDALFLVSRLGTPDAGFAVLAAAAALPVAVVLVLAFLAIPVAAARHRDADAATWRREAARLVVLQPVRSAVVLVLSTGLVATCMLLPTMLPFLAFSVPGYLALATWQTEGGASGGGPQDATE